MSYHNKHIHFWFAGGTWVKLYLKGVSCSTQFSLQVCSKYIWMLSHVDFYILEHFVAPLNFDYHVSLIAKLYLLQCRSLSDSSVFVFTCELTNSSWCVLQDNEDVISAGHVCRVGHAGAICEGGGSTSIR